MGFCRQRFEFISKLSIKPWVVVEGSGIHERALLCSMASLVPQSGRNTWKTNLFFYIIFSFMHLMQVCSKQSLPGSSGVTFPCDGVSCSEIDGAPLQIHSPCSELCLCSDRAEHNGSWKRDSWSMCSCCSQLHPGHSLPSALWWRIGKKEMDLSLQHLGLT